MSVRVEWANAGFTSVRIAPQGEEIGDDTVDAEAALVFEADSVFVIEGSKRQLAVKLQAALDALGVGAPTP